MAWLAVNPYKEEVVFDTKPIRDNEFRYRAEYPNCDGTFFLGIILPKGSIYKLTGKT